ncbi:MAG TPA: cell division protein FtsA [Bacteroidales bacterium]|nr:cell division protein FtsA [Bacteroidales bacterium]
MSQKEDFVAAIDIGTTKIVAIVGKRKENGKIEILGMSKTASKGVKRGVVLNIEEAVNSIQKTVEDVQFTIGKQLSDVYVGIAGQHIKSIKNRGYINRDSYDDEITKEDINALIQDMYKIPIDIGEEIIHVLPQNYIVDNETGVKNPVGMSGKRVEANFHIVIGQVASAKNIGKCIAKAGLKLNQLVLEPLASSEAVLTADEKEAGVALVDIGGGTTDIAVYYDDIIRHTAVIPFGGDVVTKDIKEGCSILQRQAELLKMQYGSALGDLAKEEEVVSIPGISGREPKEISFKSLAYIIQSRMEEIFDAVIYEIENSGYFDKLSAGIVLTGGGALLKHLPALVKFKTGLDVRIGYPTEHLASDAIAEVNHPMYATSVGLIIKGFEQNDKNKVSPKAKIKEKEIELEENFEEEELTERKDNKYGFISNLKKVFTDIFDEDDAEM